MEIEIRECSSLENLGKAFSPISHYFGGDPSSEEMTRIEQVFDYRRAIYASENGLSVGGAAAHAYELTVPGGTVPAAGITIVGVKPTHRRRGILRQLMQKQLDQVRAWNEPVAFLWASEETIYGRFGYGMASLNGSFQVPNTANDFAQPFRSRGEIRILSLEDAYEPISQLYDRIRLEHPGMYSRTENWWKLRRMFEPPERKGPGNELNRAVLFIDGKPEGYALYRVNTTFEGAHNEGHLQVVEALASTADATAEIWRFLLDIDWVPRVKVDFAAVDHPLLFLLARPRQMKLVVGDALWVRLVDVEQALKARRIGDGDPVVLGIRDAFCPSNEGCYRVGNGTVERTSDAADISLDVSAMGSVYLGGFSFQELARARRVEEITEGALVRADALFPSDRAPWCPEIF